MSDMFRMECRGCEGGPGLGGKALPEAPALEANAVKGNHQSCELSIHLKVGYETPGRNESLVDQVGDVGGDEDVAIRD